MKFSNLFSDQLCIAPHHPCVVPASRQVAEADPETRDRQNINPPCIPQLNIVPGTAIYFPPPAGYYFSADQPTCKIVHPESKPVQHRVCMTTVKVAYITGVDRRRLRPYNDWELRQKLERVGSSRP